MMMVHDTAQPNKMAKPIMTTHLSSKFLLLVTFIVSAEGWSPAWLLQSAALGWTIAMAPIVNPPPSTAAAAATLEERIQKSLRPASEDQPQIKIPSNLVPAESKAPIVQGLVYLADLQERPGYLDTLILTVRDRSRPEQVLAGAKLPVSMIRFPLDFRMYDQNILPDKRELWNQIEGDLLVQAKVCPEGTPLPCSDGESSMSARGIAKVVRGLPGMEDGTQIRTGASLRLERRSGPPTG